MDPEAARSRLSARGFILPPTIIVDYLGDGWSRIVGQVERSRQ